MPADPWEFRFLWTAIVMVASSGLAARAFSRKLWVLGGVSVSFACFNLAVLILIEAKVAIR